MIKKTNQVLRWIIGFLAAGVVSFLLLAFLVLKQLPTPHEIAEVLPPGQKPPVAVLDQQAPGEVAASGPFAEPPLTKISPAPLRRAN